MKDKIIEIGFVAIALFLIALFVVGCDEEIETKRGPGRNRG